MIAESEDEDEARFDDDFTGRRGGRSSHYRTRGGYRGRDYGG